jgi:chloramphenicol-sensitive protein RarD
MTAALTEASEDERRAGFAATVAAAFLWGFLPLYLKLIAFADAREVLGVRILWCVPAALAAVFLVSGWRRGLRELAGALKPRMLGTLAVSAVFIFLNWGLYVWLVLQSRIIEASLAYFITPLVAVAAGVVFFKERSSKAQYIAIALAGVGVVIQGVALGAPPWLALALCATWSVYAIIRKWAPVPAATGLFIETLAMTPAAIALLYWAASAAPLAFNASIGNAFLLALAGPITALPLVLFTFGARRVSFTATGLLQFLAPTLQFVTGLAFGEPFTLLRGVSFVLLWAGLAFFVWDALARARRV